MAFLFVLAALAQDAPKPAAAVNEGSISGTVLQSASGAPLRDVEIYANRGAGTSVNTITDEQGRYALHGLAAGQYRVTASAPDREGRVGFGPNATRQITLGAGQDLTKVDIRLVIHAAVRGKVVDQNKEPVPGIRVVLVAREYFSGALRAVLTSSGVTDDLGEYTIDRVQPGRAYLVRADRGMARLNAFSDAPLDAQLRRAAVVPTYYPNSTSMQGAEALVLRDGEVREGVDIRIARSASFCLEGDTIGVSAPDARFTIAETQPASGTVGNGGSSYHGMPSGTVAPDGKLRICDLHPGEYELTLAESRKGVFAALAAFGTSIVTIGDRDVRNVRLMAGPLLPLSGEVVWDGPPPDPPVATKLRLDLEAITRTNRGNAESAIPGEFSFAEGLAMDDYSLDIGRVPRGVYVKEVSYGDRSVLYEPIRVGSAIGNAGVRITLARDGGVIGARVVDGDGHPVSECGVVVLPASAPSEAVLAAALKTGKTDQNGSWSSATLAPGKYYVLATMDELDKSPETIAKLWKARNRAQEVEVAPNGKPSVTVTPKSLD